MSFPRYPDYKASGVEWLGEVPTHWSRSALRYVVNRWYTGGTPDTDVPEYWADTEDGTPWVSIADITRNNEISQTDRALSQKGLDAKGLDVMPTGTLLISMYASIGKVATLAVPSAANQAILGMEFPSGFEKAFIAYWLQHVEGNLTQFSSSNTQDNLNAAKVRAIPVFVPSYSEQRTIAAFLDRETAKIDALVAEQRRLMELLKEKRQAAISHAVTKGLNPDAPMKESGVEWLGDVPAHWETTRLKYAAALIVDCPHDTPVYTDDGPFKVIRTADLNEGQLDDERMFRVSEEEFAHRNRRAALMRWDIVYGREGERWGHAGIVPASNAYCLGQRMMQFRACETFDPTYLMWSLNADTTYMQGEVDTVGATSPHVNVGTIRNYALVEPPLEEQKQIAAYVDEIKGRFDALIDESTKAVDLLNGRRTALISAAVTGQIDVRGLGSEAAA